MKKFVKFTILLMVPLACVQVAFAKKHHPVKAETAPIYKEQPIVIAPSFTPTWYVGANIGESRTHDAAAPGSGDSVTQIGPGWSADLGYKFIRFYNAVLAGEIGYTQYDHSSETTPGVVVAKTDHFSSYAAFVGEYPLIQSFGVMGKVGLAYSYAEKIFEASGAANSANDWGLYYGGGLTYSMTPQASLIVQWDRARGNDKTGSTDLLSLGVEYSFI
jgi:outer membrane protein with beta-barrel domain